MQDMLFVFYCDDNLQRKKHAIIIICDYCLPSVTTYFRYHYIDNKITHYLYKDILYYLITYFITMYR